MLAQSEPSFAALLSRHRHARGWTQEELAERAGLSVRGISDLERGARRSPQPYTVKQLVDVFALSPGEQAAFHVAAQIHSRSLGKERATPRSNLPTSSTPLIGRKREVAAVVALLRHPDIRLVTLTGTGGTGKTRVAIQVAAELVSEYADGVIFVPLAAVTDPALVPSAISQAFALREVSNRSLPEALSGRDILLVLDNFEQVEPAATTIVELLDFGAQINILITSRAALRVSAEHEFPILPFTLPVTERLPDFDELAQYDVIQLFSQRAVAVDPDFRLNPDNAALVAAIATRLEGLPLAIELAAARSKVLSPKAMLDRLERRLPLLTGGARDAPARHQTLRKAIAWSYDLLDRDSMALFRRLSVFAGGFSLAAAAVILELEDDIHSEMTALDHVTLLVDRNLVIRTDPINDEPRFMMLETLREFAHEQLTASSENQQIRELHMGCFLTLARDAEPQLTSANQIEWFNLLEAELPNIRLALEWAIAHHPSHGLCLVAALNRFWDHHSHVEEGMFWIESALAADSGEPSRCRAKALWGAGVLSLVQGDLERAGAFLNTSLAMALNTGDDYIAGFALNGLGSVALVGGDPIQARAHHEQGLAMMRELGDKDGIAALLSNLGNGAFVSGEIDRAIRFCSESLALYRALGSDHGVASTLGVLGRSWLEAGNATAARTMLLDGLKLGQEIGNKWYITLFLVGLAGTAILEEEWERGTRLFGAVDMISRLINVALSPYDLETNARYLTLARHQLDRQTFETAWRAGQAMSIEDAIDDAFA